MSKEPTPRRTKELRIPVGFDAAGNREWLPIGWVVESDYGGGRIKRDFEISLSALNPVLYQQAKQFAGKSAFVLVPGVEFAKRYKNPNGAAEPDSDPSESPANDADCGHE